MSKLFSIVIPTRNRLETTFHAVRTCLFDPGDDYEVIVFDNASEPAVTTESLELNDPRVTIYRSDTTLPMFQSWETAVSHATGEYVIVIGDDDGLLPSTLNILRQLIPQYPNLPIRWARISYHWPNHPYPIKRDSLKIPMSNTGYVLEAKPVIMGVAHARLPHFALPMLYNSAAPRRILERIKEKCGRLFLSTCPDISSGFAIAYESGRYLSMECPLTIAGISGKSNGIATTSAANMKVSQGRSQVAQEFMDLNRDHGMPLPHRSLPAIGIMPIGNASSFLYVQSKLFPNDRNYQLDANHLMKVCTEEICRRPMNEASELLAILREHVTSQPNLTWVEPAQEKISRVEAVDPMTKPPPRGFDELEKILAVDTSLFQVRDVHAASILAEKILAYQNRGFRLKIRTPRQNLVASGRKLLGDIVHRHKVPSFIDCD